MELKCSYTKKRPVHNVLLSKQSFWKRGRQRLVGSLHDRPARRVKQRSRIITSSGMHDDTCSCMLYVHVYYILANSIPHRPSNNIYVFSNTWVPMQSGNETNNPLKSGPAKARPAGLVMLPLVLTVENDLHIQMLKACALPANSNCVQGVLEQVILPHLYTTPHHALHKY